MFIFKCSLPQIIASFISIRIQKTKIIHKINIASSPSLEYSYSNAAELFTPLKESTTLTNMSLKAFSLLRRDNGNNDDDDVVENSWLKSERWRKFHDAEKKKEILFWGDFLLFPLNFITKKFSSTETAW